MHAGKFMLMQPLAGSNFFVDSGEIGVATTKHSMPVMLSPGSADDRCLIVSRALQNDDCFTKYIFIAIEGPFRGTEASSFIDAFVLCPGRVPVARDYFSRPVHATSWAFNVDTERTECCDNIYKALASYLWAMEHQTKPALPTVSRYDFHVLMHVIQSLTKPA